MCFNTLQHTYITPVNVMSKETTKYMLTNLCYTHIAFCYTYVTHILHIHHTHVHTFITHMCNTHIICIPEKYMQSTHLSEHCLETPQKL